MKRVGICTATRWELNAVRRAVGSDPRRLNALRGFVGRRGRCEVMIIQTGVGMIKAARASRTLLEDYQIDLVLSSGFACALRSSNIGTLLIGTYVVGEEKSDDLLGGQQEFPCARDVIDTSVETARAVGISTGIGRFVTVPRVLWRADEKRRIAIKTGAVGLDMESAAVGAVAAERGVPFAIVRTVSDLLEEDLPMDFNLFLNPIDWPKGTLACLARPSSLLGLNRLRSQAVVASEQLTKFFRRWLDDVHV